MPAVESLSVGPVSNRSYSTTSAAGGRRYLGNEPTCGLLANHVPAHAAVAHNRKLFTTGTINVDDALATCSSLCLGVFVVNNPASPDALGLHLPSNPPLG